MCLVIKTKIHFIHSGSTLVLCDCRPTMTKRIQRYSVLLINFTPNLPDASIHISSEGVGS